MPIHGGKDSQGYYFQFGVRGHKYHYTTYTEEQKAYKKCLLQARAIEWSKYK